MNPGTAKPPFWGKGLLFPVRTQAGRLATAADEDLIHQSIRIIIGTNPGERVMRPDFGAGLSAFVFEPMNSTTLQALRKRVQDSLIDWEPRIDVQEVTVTPGTGAEDGLVRIEVTYRVRATNAVRNLVYPFYLQEGPTR